VQPFIEFLKYLLIGIVQGITEPLPISSSGHLVIIQTILNIKTVDLFLEITLNFASLIAVMILFKSKIMSLVKGNYHYIIKRDKAYKKDFDYAILIGIGIIPAGVIGFLFRDLFDGFLTLLSVGISLLITGTFLLIVQTQSTQNNQSDITIKDALVIGLFQVFALIPGISRSGSTFIGGLIRKIRFQDVLEFSFMMYIPISLATMALEIIQFDGLGGVRLYNIIGAFSMSVLFTYLAFKWFVYMVKQGNLKYFGFYCLGIGFISIIVSLI
jgi:undecaprenyl-diphosphatase